MPPSPWPARRTPRPIRHRTPRPNLRRTPRPTPTPDPTPEPTPDPTPEPTPEPPVVASDAVTGLSLTSDAPGELTATWNAPADAADDYRFGWAKVGEPWPSWDDSDGNLYPTATSVTILDLDPGVEYKVQVRARFGQNTSNPRSGPWARGTITLAAAPPPPPPPPPPPLEITTGTVIRVDEGETAVVGLRATSTNSDSTDPLVWTLAGGNDSSHFTLTSKGALAFSSAKDFEHPDDHNGDGMYEVDVTVTQGEATATASLQVSLVDVNDDDVRRSSQDQTVDGPPAPDAPKVHWIYKTRVTVKWTAPAIEAGDDPITAYDVQYKVHDDIKWTHGPQDVTDPGLSAEVTELAPDINYLFRVRSQAGETEGAWSDATEATTALWYSNLRAEPSERRGGSVGILGFYDATSSGWLSHRTISHNGLDYAGSRRWAGTRQRGHSHTADRTTTRIAQAQGLALDFHVDGPRGCRPTGC